MLSSPCVWLVCVCGVLCRWLTVGGARGGGAALLAAAALLLGRAGLRGGGHLGGRHDVTFERGHCRACNSVGRTTIGVVGVEHVWGQEEGRSRGGGI